MFKNEDDFKKIVSRLNIDNKPNPVHRENLRRQMLSVFNKARTKTLHAGHWQTIGRIITKRPITKLAAAAVIIIAVLIGISQFIGPIGVASPAFADVLNKIYKARTVTYKETFYPGESREFTTGKMINESGIMRSVLAHGDLMIFDFNSGKTLHLMPHCKKALLTHRVGGKRSGRLFNYLDWISTAHEKSGEFIGQEEINEQMVDMFLIDDDFVKTTIWVDPGTNLPVQVKIERLPHPDKDIIMPKISLNLKDFGGDGNFARVISISSSDGIQDKMTTVMSDFVWDAELDESVFGLEPPEGYALEERQLDVSERGENGLIEALAFWSEVSGGMFPSKINDLVDPNLVRPMLVEKFDKDGDPKEELDQAMKKVHVILKGLMFVQQRKVDGTWNYTGDAVRLGEADKPICWWKAEDSNEYRVVYGDLSIANVALEDLAE